MKLKLLKLLLISFLGVCPYLSHALITNSQISEWKRKENYLVVSIPLKLHKFDPTLAMNAHTKLSLPLIFESLLTINSQQELQPALAKKWLISPDRKSISITLKTNHRFSDGTEVTADDIVKSFSRLCSKNSHGYAEIKGLEGCGGDSIPAISVIDKYEIKFNIQSNPTTFLFQLSSPSTVITKETTRGLIGSGPYMVAEKENEYVILEKNKFYVGAPMGNSGIIFYYASNSGISSKIRHEKPDAALMYRMEEIYHFHDKHYKLIRSNPNITEILVLNNQKYPFNKKEVRAAFAKELYQNFDYSCIPGGHRAYGVIPNGIGGSITNIQTNEIVAVSLDAQTLNELKRLKPKIIIHQLLDVKNECESKQIIDAGKKLNINLVFKYHKDYSDLMPHYPDHSLDAFIDLFIFKNREAYRILEYFAQKGENYANVKTTLIDEGLKDASEATTSHGRFQAYRKINKFISDENIVIPIFYMDHGNLMSKCLSGISEDFFFNPFSELPKITKINNCELS